MKQMLLYAGLDMHKETTTGTIKDEKGNPIRVMKVNTDKDGMVKLFNRLNEKYIEAVFEASRNWPYYAKLLQPHCKKIIMGHPLRIRAIASARIKTDKIDSEILCDLLRANLIPKSYMPSLDIVELREILLYRAIISRLRASLKIKIKAILSREGKNCEFNDITCSRARLWLTKVEVSELNRYELNYLTSIADKHTNELKKLDQKIHKLQYNYPEVDIIKS